MSQTYRLHGELNFHAGSVWEAMENQYRKVMRMTHQRASKGHQSFHGATVRALRVLPHVQTRPYLIIFHVLHFYTCNTYLYET